jgi:hypothetical protein
MHYDKEFHASDLKKKLTKAQKITEVLGCGVVCFYQTYENYEYALKKCGFTEDSDTSDNDSSDEDEAKEVAAAESKKQVLPDTDVFCNGYHDRSVSTTEQDIELLITSKDAPVDLGTVSEKTLNRLLELVEKKKVKVMYYPIIPNAETINKMPFAMEHQKTCEPLGDTTPKKIALRHIDSFLNHCESNEFLAVGYLPWKLLKSDIIVELRDDKWQEKIEPIVADTIKKIDEILASDDRVAKFREMFPEMAKVEIDVDDLESSAALIANNVEEATEEATE